MYFHCQKNEKIEFQNRLLLTLTVNQKKLNDCPLNVIKNVPKYKNLRTVGRETKIETFDSIVLQVLILEKNLVSFFVYS